MANIFTPEAYQGKENDLLPKSKYNLLLMHPSTMKSLQLKKCSPVLIKTANGHLLLKCWPWDSLEKSAVSLPAFSLLKHYTTSSVTVVPFVDTVFQAERVVLIPVNHKSFMNSKAFKTFMKNKLADLYLREGMVLNFKYLGYPCAFVTKSIIPGVNGVKTSNEAQIELADMYPVDPNDSMDDSFILEKRFSEKCSLNESGNRNKLQSSTPISTPKTVSFTKPFQHTKSFVDVEAFMNEKKCSQFYCITPETKFFMEYRKTALDLRTSNLTFEDIASLDEQVNEIQCALNSVLIQGNYLSSRGILMIGPPGTGKSLIIQALQNAYKDKLFIQVVGKDSLIWESNTIPQLRMLFKDAKDNAPSVIILEDINHLCKSEDQTNISQQEKKLTQELSSMIYSLLNSAKDALVIATCQSETLLYSSLRKHGILDKEIRITIPSAFDRKQVLCKILRRFKNDLTASQISEISNMAHGFVGGDLKKLCCKATQLSYLQKKEKAFEGTSISFDDLKASLKFVKPSSVVEFSFEVPNVKWDDIGGMEEVKSTIKEMVEWPLKYPEKLRSFKIMVPRGILMYGPPGCCKTMMAKALATEGRLNFINVKSSQVFSKYVGDSEKSVSELFKKARSAAPCILFLDEIDSLASKRGSSSGNSNVGDRVLTQILIEIDGIDVLSEGVCIIAATNRPDNIDPSLLRPGRFDRLVYVPLPDSDTRRKIFEVMLQRKPISSDIKLSYLVEKTENYTGAEISDVCSQACMLAIKEDTSSCSSVVTMAHLLKALLNVQPRTTQEMIESFKNYHNKKICNAL